MSDCLLCDRLASPTPPPGGWVYQDEHWAVSGHAAIAVPGWLALQTRRHVATLAELTDDEAATLGPLLRAASQWSQAATGADRTYIYALGEGVRHVHILVGTPLSRDEPSDRGAALLTRILSRDKALDQPEQRTSITEKIAQIAAADTTTAGGARAAVGHTEGENVTAP